MVKIYCHFIVILQQNSCKTEAVLMKVIKATDYSF